MIIIEYMRGGSLESATLNQTEQDLAVIALSKALAFLHLKRIIHRDLKPSNVLLTSEKECKIVDFGSARAVELGLTMTKLPLAMQFSAPEVQERPPISRQTCGATGWLRCPLTRQPTSAYSKTSQAGEPPLLHQGSR